MLFLDCNNCRTRECEYRLAKCFIDEFQTKGYSFAGCPDKEDCHKMEAFLMKKIQIENPIFKRMVNIVRRISGL